MFYQQQHARAPVAPSDLSIRELPGLKRAFAEANQADAAAQQQESQGRFARGVAALYGDLKAPSLTLSQAHSTLPNQLLGCLHPCIL